MIGCVSAGLDQYAATPERREIILRLSKNALSWLNSQGGVLSVTLLNSFGLGGEGAEFTKDLPTEVFSRVGDAFIRLLNGEIVWDTKT